MGESAGAITHCPSPGKRFIDNMPAWQKSTRSYMSGESCEPQSCLLSDSTRLQAISKYRILVAEDHALDRSSLIASLTAVSQVEICGRATNARETVRFAKKMRPDLVILSINLLAIGGIDTVRRIRSALPETEVLVVTLHSSPRLRAAEAK